MRAIGDHFSEQADIYENARPHYPDVIFSDFHTRVTEQFTREHFTGNDETPIIVADIGAGSGQATQSLAPLFSHLFAIDPIPDIIARCPAATNVTRLAARAESVPLAAHQLHGIFCAQSAHWFDLPAFHAEMRRVCHPHAPIAFASYGRTRISPDIDQQMDEFEKIIGPYWPAGRDHVDSHYRHLDIEFPILARQEYPMHLNWSVDQFCAYVASWSSVTAYNRVQATNCLDELFPALRAQWDGLKTVHWPLTVITATVA